MKNLIKQRLQEYFQHKEIPYDPKPEMQAASGYSSLSKPSYKVDLNKIRFRMTKAAEMATQFKQTNPDDNYFMLPTEGDGFYQVEFRHDGQIKTKHVRASSDMEQRNGAFQPSDVGTCKTFQNIARFCFVKAGKNGESVGASPAEDAANKALIIFKNEILDFLSSGQDDGKGAEISKEKMNDKQAKHKVKKDLETDLGRRVSDSEWIHYLQTGQKPNTKSGIQMDPEEIQQIEKRQKDAIARREKALNRNKL